MEKKDKQIVDLMSIVTKKREEIKSLEKPNYKTNCCFSYSEEKPQETIVLHTAMLINVIKISAFLLDKKNNYDSACSVLQLEEYTEFKWLGYSIDEWMHDLKLRADKIQIGDKRKKLDVLEQRLNAIISPELKASLELQSIAKELL